MQNAANLNTQSDADLTHEVTKQSGVVLGAENGCCYTLSANGIV
jgi:hypothetical protein